MSQRQYVNTRVGAKKRKADMYPSYEKIREAKRQCYPDPLLVLTTVSETKVKVPLQRLLDHTAERIFKVLESKNKSIESGDFNMIATGGGRMVPVTKPGTDSPLRVNRVLQMAGVKQGM